MNKLFLIFLVFLLSSPGFAETVVLGTGRVVEGHIIEVEDEYIRMIVGDDILKLRFRNMDIGSAEKYRYYTPQPYTEPLPEKESFEAPSYQTLLAQALELAKKGQYDEAIAEIDKIVNFFGDIPDLFMYRAGINQELGKTEEAIKDFSKAIKLEPENITLYARRGWLYQGQGKWDEAIADYSRVLKDEPGNYEIRLERYNIYKTIENWRRARKDLQIILLMEPESGEAYLDLAFLNYYLGSYYMAWQNVYEAGERKVKIPPEFINVLKAKLEDPFLGEKKIPAKPLKERLEEFLAVNVIAVNAALFFIVTAAIISLLPARKRRQEQKETAETDEGVFKPVMTIKMAKLSKRIAAGIIDLIIISVIAWGVQIVSSFDIFALITGVLWILKDSFWGVSVGKGLVGLRVVDEHGFRSVFLQGFLRNFTLGIPIVIFYVLFWCWGFKMDMLGRIALLVTCLFFLIEGLSILVSKRSRIRIGDRLAGTFVHDLHPSWPSWLFLLISLVLFSVYLTGMVVMNMTYSKAFLYGLSPFRYYNGERDFFFAFPKGWKIASEGDGGIVLEKTSLDGASMLFFFNQEVQEYPLDLCVRAYNQSMQESGLELRNEEKIQVSGLPAYKIGFLDNKTGTAIMIIYFKKDEGGDLYTLQVSSSFKTMGPVMKDAMALMRSFRFE
ncbi:MAG: tetratricopeptide repeat protein [Candidatus Omnitrophota bacterium]